MRYYVFKLKFLTPVRFGAEGHASDLGRSQFFCRCDTFFSALCHACLMRYGEDALKDLLNDSIEGNFTISDLFPYKGAELYLPKPYLPVRRTALKNIPVEEERGPSKKEMKKLQFIPATGLASYLETLENGAHLGFDPVDFAKEHRATRAAVTGLEDTKPYSVAAYTFFVDCGLYLIVRARESFLEPLTGLLELLGEEGIGGKRSSGFGKFMLYEELYEMPLYESDEVLYHAFERGDGLYMALSSILPSEEDLDGIDSEGAFYRVIRRSGFIASRASASLVDPVKKKDVFMFASGSCFQRPMKGSVRDVSGFRGFPHPVYRYGKGLFMRIPS